MSRFITIGTRRSRLARRQTDQVRARLASQRPAWRFALKVIRTQGDRDRQRPIPALGRVGVFTGALERALAAGRIDVAVHSLKDVPTSLADGLALEVVTPREDPREALAAREGARLADLPAGACVGTGSVRRAAFLLALRGDLRVVPIRGNVETRLDRVVRGEVDAVLVALAGLNRLGLADRASEVFDPETIPPAPGQGAVAVEYRAADAEVAALLSEAREREAAVAVMTERAVLRELGGGCQAPVGVLARMAGADQLRVIAAVAAPDGSAVVRAMEEGPADAALMAERVVRALRAAGLHH